MIIYKNYEQGKLKHLGFTEVLKIYLSFYFKDLLFYNLTKNVFIKNVFEKYFYYSIH